ncbi:MAG: InlB B-repeat-containing protein, partial [Lachnospiraceae bacterium]|nr:InlB B-repeat-containing protein [Lachnospiraceae bacterium]
MTLEDATYYGDSLDGNPIYNWTAGETRTVYMGVNDTDDWDVTAPAKSKIDYDPAKYEIDGWYKYASFTEKWDFNTNTMPNNDLYLYGKAVPRTYKITWDMNGGSMAESDKTGTYTYGTGLTLPAASKVTPPTGKLFDYWTVSGTKATAISKTQTGAVTVKAIYKNASYKITWDMNGGSMADSDKTSTYTYGTGLTLPAASKVTPPTGKLFDYWTVGGTKATAISSTQTNAVTVKAIYKNATYKITWNLGEGVWTSDYRDQVPETYTYSEGLTLPVGKVMSTNPLGYRFDHWEMNGKTVTSISTTQTEPVTIYAKYVAKTYAITWDLGDGSMAESDKTKEYTYGEGLVLPAASKVTPPSGYKFNSWSIDGEKTTVISNTMCYPVTVKANYESLTKEYNLVVNYFDNSNKKFLKNEFIKFVDENDKGATGKELWELFAVKGAEIASAVLLANGQYLKSAGGEPVDMEIYNSSGHVFHFSDKYSFSYKVYLNISDVEWTLPKDWTHDFEVNTQNFKHVAFVKDYTPTGAVDKEKSIDIDSFHKVTAYIEGGDTLTISIPANVTVYLPEDSSQLFNLDEVETLTGLDNLKTDKVENMEFMFADLLTETLDISTWDTSNVTNMSGMFEGCENVKVLNLGSFDTANVTNMTSMFEG